MTRHITLHIPIYDTHTEYREQYAKVIEEYNEFRKELFSEAPPDRMLHELQDVVQSYVHALYQMAKTTALDERDALERVIATVEHHNYLHRKKVDRYRHERGWT